MRIAFKTFGCKANSVDTDALYAEAMRRGFVVVPESEIADAYVINSCTVTSSADRDARGQALRFKRRNPGALVAVVGCYAQVAKEELLSLPEIDFVVGTANKGRVLDHFSEAMQSDGWERDRVEVPRGYLPELFPGSRHARATVKVQDGCNFSCSFCIIPQARGRSRSLAPELVLRQLDDAWEQGFEEVVLTGIHLAHYGWDLGTDLMELLKRALARPQGPRLRVSTLDPFEIPDELIAMLGQEERLCPHFHIALQSGSDRVLARMRRIYKAEEFATATRKIEQRCRDTFLGVDVIVGFAGEGEEEIEETVRCLESTFWAKLHVFPYSVRSGTRAEGLDGHVPPEEIAARSERLRHLSERRYRSFLDSQLGKQRQVLLERESVKHPGVWLGHTDNYLPTFSLAPGGRSRMTRPGRIERVEGERVWTSAIDGAGANGPAPTN